MQPQTPEAQQPERSAQSQSAISPEEEANAREQAAPESTPADAADREQLVADAKKQIDAAAAPTSAEPGHNGYIVSREVVQDKLKTMGRTPTQPKKPFWKFW
jgi:hypothetical protein